jgi:hypothetical protein
MADPKVVGVVCAFVALGCARGHTTPTAEEPAPTLEASERSANVQHVLSVVAAERRRRGLSPADVVDDLRPLESAVAAILRGGAPRDAIRTAMQRIAEWESGEVQAWIVETDQLDDVQLPSAFVEQEEPSVAVIVVERTPASATRARYMVCFMLLEAGLGPGIQSY